MGLPLPKPDLRQLVAAIHEHVELGKTELQRVIGDCPFDVEKVIQQIVARAIDYGINAQRDAIIEAPEYRQTPLVPPPDDEVVGDVEIPRPSKLPKGI